MADVFERTVGLTADEVARLEELDRLNPGGKDAALFAEAAALAGKAQRAAQARLGVVGGGPCRHCGTPLEANGTFEVDGRRTHSEAVCLYRVVGQRDPAARRSRRIDVWEAVAMALVGELPSAGVVVDPAGKVHRLWGIWYKHKGAPGELVPTAGTWWWPDAMRWEGTEVQAKAAALAATYANSTAGRTFEARPLP